MSKLWCGRVSHPSRHDPGLKPEQVKQPAAESQQTLDGN